MINLKVRTEYSFRYAFGKLQETIDQQQATSASITDHGNTFGHRLFHERCKKAGKKPILGVELAFVEDCILKVKQNFTWVTLLARNQKGLQELYALVTQATKHKHYENRLSYDYLNRISDDIVVIIEDARLEPYVAHRKHSYYGVSPLANYGDYNRTSLPKVALSDNIYAKDGQVGLYETILGKGADETKGKKSFDATQSRLEPSHILSETEWYSALWWMTEDEKEEAISNTYKIDSEIEFYELPKAELPTNILEESLEQLTIREAMERRGIDLLNTPEYYERFKRELGIIEQKNFSDYFLIVYDLINYAKQHMLVGPGRGASDGSLICYLIGITDVEPLKNGLLFERFIDINRTSDYPDIDIDFEDSKRDMVFDYLQEKYGEERVSKLGVISYYKAKMILNETAKILKIKPWELDPLKNAIVETDAGDDRPVLEDTFQNTKVGQEFAEKFPQLTVTKDIENHARHFGKHAAAVIVSREPLTNYCSVDYSVDSCQLDKRDAEALNLLKIDCLGLRTLSIISNCLNVIGKDRKWLLEYPLDDEKAFNVINDGRYYGVFQFEGSALISLAKEMHVKEFNDLSAITSLARPGTLSNGEAKRYIEIKNSGKVYYHHPMLESILKETYGVIVYQEQVMEIVRRLGNFSWEDTTKIRKAIGKSMGSDYINKMKPLFVNGCKANKIEDKAAEIIWDNILAMGSYTFNKSHAVAYSLLSYWCMVLKAYHPLEFALATLQDAKDDDQVISVLRELVKEGFKYKTFDKDLSEIGWSIKDGVLVGGFTNIKGVGVTKAKELIKKRETGVELTATQARLLHDAVTPYDSIFEFKDKFGHFYQNFELFFTQQPTYLADIEPDTIVRFFAKSIKVIQKDINDQYFLDKRNGRKVEGEATKILDIHFVDDTDMIKCRISENKYEKLKADEILNQHKIGSYYFVVGRVCKDFKFIFIDNIKRVTLKEINEKIYK